MSYTFSGPDRLSVAQTWVEDNRDDGVHCPCCGQFAKTYRRKFNSGLAYAMVQIARAYPVGVAFLTKDVTQVHDPGMARHWGLLKRVPDTRAWKLTQTGMEFAVIYDNQLLELDDSEWVDIRQALGDKFDYEELMAS
jgi:hypothetical protein